MQTLRRKIRELLQDLFTATSFHFYYCFYCCCFSYPRDKRYRNRIRCGPRTRTICRVYAKYLLLWALSVPDFAVPVLAASTGYVVAELFGWRDSLSDSPHKARGFYMILTISFLIGIGIVFSGIRPVHALLYSQVLGGILAPILILLIIFLCNNKKLWVYMSTDGLIMFLAGCQ